VATLFFDAVIIGAGAAGLFCAGQAGQRGLKVLLIDHAESGGREDPHLGRRALQLHQPRPGPCGAAQALCGAEPAVLPLGAVALHPADFIALVQKARHPLPREAQGPAVCDRSAEDIIAMLLAECEAGQVDALAALQRQKYSLFGL
jgi:predicted flavoprotein YhiN